MRHDAGYYGAVLAGYSHEGYVDNLVLDCYYELTKFNFGVSFSFTHMAWHLGIFHLVIQWRFPV